MENISNIQPKEIVPGFFGRFVHGSQATLSLFEIKQGSSLPEHHHVHEQITFILEGTLEMTIGGQTYLLTPGTVHVIPSNTPHSAFAHTECKVIDAFSPVREDYKF
jgi:quercetin dioxygenase-like cupin family protein